MGCAIRRHFQQKSTFYKRCHIRDLFIGKRHLTSCLDNLHLQNDEGSVKGHNNGIESRCEQETLAQFRVDVDL